MNSKTSADGGYAVEREWTYLTGADGQPNRIVCRDGFEVFNIIRGAFQGDHYVSLYRPHLHDQLSIVTARLGKCMPALRATLQAKDQLGQRHQRLI